MSRALVAVSLILSSIVIHSSSLSPHSSLMTITADNSKTNSALVMEGDTVRCVYLFCHPLFTSAAHKTCFLPPDSRAGPRCTGSSVCGTRPSTSRAAPSSWASPPACAPPPTRASSSAPATPATSGYRRSVSRGHRMWGSQGVIPPLWRRPCQVIA